MGSSSAVEGYETRDTQQIFVLQPARPRTCEGLCESASRVFEASHVTLELTHVTICGRG